MTRVLIAGIGNVLRRDDGFGPAVIEALQSSDGFDNARAVNVGIGGIALVHELMAGYDALVVVDSMRRGGAPGALYVLQAHVPQVAAIPDAQRAALAADMHDIGPERGLIVARAAGVLPEQVWLVGCEPADVDELTLDLSQPVRAALPRAVESIRALVRRAATADARET
jgi:hydrogenase maturation protease